MRKYYSVAMMSVSLLLGLMIGLEFHIDRSSPAVAYTSYLAATDDLSSALQTSAHLNRMLKNVGAQYQTLVAASQIHSHGMQNLQEELKNLEQQAGLTPRVGEGISITINYDPDLPVLPGLVYVNEAQQLQMVVNDLESVGAVAIAINGERLVTTSSIRSVSGLAAGSGPFAGVVQVNGDPVAAPYVIQAVGPVNAMTNLLTAEGLKGQFAILDQSFTVQVFHRPRLLTVPAYTGVLPGKYSVEVGM